MSWTPGSGLGFGGETEKFQLNFKCSITTGMGVSVAIARAVSMCIRSSRNPLKGARWCMQDGAALAVMLHE